MTRRVLPFAALIFFVLAGCGGDSDAPQEPLAPPPVNPALAVHAQGELLLNVERGGSESIDPRALGGPAAAAVPCGRLVLLLSWRAQGKKSLEFTQRTEGGETKLLDGHEGVASVTGCALIEAKNRGGDAVVAELRYVIAESR